MSEEKPKKEPEAKPTSKPKYIPQFKDIPIRLERRRIYRDHLDDKPMENKRNYDSKE